MKRSGSILLVLFGLSLATGAGCASRSASVPASAPEATVRMDQNRLERVFSDQVEAITGPTGALQSQIDGIPIYCISDPRNDRMRILSPVARVAGIDPRLPEILLRANFHTALDARYAISDDAIWATYLHPLSSLTTGEIESAVAQVISLVKTYGKSFSSGALAFPGPSRQDEPAPAETDSSSPPL